MKTEQPSTSHRRSPRVRPLGIFVVALLFALGIWGLSGFGVEDPEVTAFQPSEAAAVYYGTETGQAEVRSPQALTGVEGSTNGPVRYPEAGRETQDWQPEVSSLSPAATTTEPQADALPVAEAMEREQ